MEREHNVDREDVYNAVDSERDYQDAGEGNSRPGPHTVPVFLATMKEYLVKADKAYRGSGDEDALHGIRKVVAIGVMCMEQHGAPMREGYGPEDTQEEGDEDEEDEEDEEGEDDVEGTDHN